MARTRGHSLLLGCWRDAACVCMMISTVDRSIIRQTDGGSYNSIVRDYPVVLNIDGACAPVPR